jgi:hypothetical protein
LAAGEGRGVRVAAAGWRRARVAAPRGLTPQQAPPTLAACPGPPPSAARPAFPGSPPAVRRDFRCGSDSDFAVKIELIFSTKISVLSWVESLVVLPKDDGVGLWLGTIEMKMYWRPEPRGSSPSKEEN